MSRCQAARLHDLEQEATQVVLKEETTQVVHQGGRQRTVVSDGPRLAGDEALRRVSSAVLRIDGVSKRFGGTQALSDVSMTVGRGEVVALLGENGAGKSTLIKILAGVHAVDSGSISYDGMDMTIAVRRMPI